MPATAEEIVWADAHGIDLRRECEAERSAGVRIASALIDQARQRRLRAIDRAIARRGDWLSELHQEGQHVAERTQQERREHQLSAEPYRDAGQPWMRWRPVCACGWAGPPTSSREEATQQARNERSHLFRMLNEALQHTAAREEAA